MSAGVTFTTEVMHLRLSQSGDLVDVVFQQRAGDGNGPKVEQTSMRPSELRRLASVMLAFASEVGE